VFRSADFAEADTSAGIKLEKNFVCHLLLLFIGSANTTTTVPFRARGHCPIQAGTRLASLRTVPELDFTEDADAAMSKLESDPSKSRILAKLNAALAVLAANPSDERVRRVRFTKANYWAIEVRAGDEELTILWNGGHLPETVRVEFVGKFPTLR
jgi:hypothetical protein